MLEYCPLMILPTPHTIVEELPAIVLVFHQTTEEYRPFIVFIEPPIKFASPFILEKEPQAIIESYHVIVFFSPPIIVAYGPFM